jgi:hypothetical protein
LTPGIKLCAEWGVEPGARPGRRTIYDACFLRNGAFVGIDFTTKDLNDERYADGGVCSVGNLLRFLGPRDDATLIVAEFGYKIENDDVRFVHVAAAPIHCLSPEILRIENLGTGQVRLDESLSTTQIRWNQSKGDFFAGFCPRCLLHYERVQVRAEERAAAIQAFVDSHFEELRLK